MTRLEENLQICRKAIEYAKAAVPRSANQTYFKLRAIDRGNGKARRHFLLGATRFSSNKGFDSEGDYQTIAEVKNVRQATKAALTVPDVRQRNKALDKLVADHGKNFFFDNASNPLRTVAHYRAQAEGEHPDLTELDKHFKNKFEKRLGVGFDDVEDDELEKAENIFEIMESAHQARKYGMGNCYEKACLAATYLFEHSYAGRKLALCYLDPEYKGYTGKIASAFKKGAGRGDHAFCVYDLLQEGESVAAWGDTAVIADGWMNDVYPAAHFMGYRKTYKGEYINLKQTTVRNMICISYRNHIKTQFTFDLPQGPNFNQFLASVQAS